MMDSLNESNIYAPSTMRKNSFDKIKRASLEPFEIIDRDIFPGGSLTSKNVPIIPQRISSVMAYDNSLKDRFGALSPLAKSSLNKINMGKSPDYDSIFKKLVKSP
jgi:hypothetical protein